MSSRDGVRNSFHEAFIKIQFAGRKIKARVLGFPTG